MRYKKINENPDFIGNLGFGDDDQAIFGYVDDEFIYDKTYKITHGEYESRSDGDWDYAGRLWSESKIMSFWDYPSPTMLKSILNELERLDKNLNFTNNDWLIEVIIGEDLDDNDWQTRDYETDIISIDDYEKYCDSNFMITKFPKEEREKEHELSPLLKDKRNKKIKGFGSDLFNGTEDNLKYRYAKKLE